MKKAHIIVIIIIAVGGIIAAAVWQNRKEPQLAPLTNEEVTPAPETALPPSPEEAQGTEPQPLPFEIVSYKSLLGGFMISHPDIYQVRETELPEGRGTLPPMVAISSPELERAGTNLIESSVIIGTSTSRTIVGRCTEEQEGESRLGSIMVSGTEFDIFTHNAAAAGNQYQTIRYRTLRQNSCYEITLLMHSGNIGNYPEGTVKEYDRAGTLERLKTIFYSITFSL